jgi:uncharacterized protein with GYD domain
MRKLQKIFVDAQFGFIVDSTTRCSYSLATSEHRQRWHPPKAAPQEEGRRAMETYIMLTKLTDEGRKTLKQKPNRTKEVNKEIEGMGGRIVAQYAVLGPYDYVNVVEAPDNRTIAKISMELGSRGTMEIMTLPAVNF